MFKGVNSSNIHHGQNTRDLYDLYDNRFRYGYGHGHGYGHCHGYGHGHGYGYGHGRYHHRYW
jgi:hypothetical protein